MTEPILFLGLESSCDDTCAAVVRVSGGVPEVLANIVESQTSLHAAYGGVVPEIAARAHAERLDHCVRKALQTSQVALRDLHGVAVTAGPGLIGGVLSGVMCAKGLCAGANLPLVGVNHLAGHALSPGLSEPLAFPYLMLLVSGGHCQFLIVKSPVEFQRLGGTIDDAPGEAFDKVARLTGLAQPGGPAIENAAKSGDPKRFPLPRPLLNRPGCDMSFSGLKTAVLRARDSVMNPGNVLNSQDVFDLAASFQAAVTDVLSEKSARALDLYLEMSPEKPVFSVAGGVAANATIRTALKTLCTEKRVRFSAPGMAYCTDNAAMIAWAGFLKFQRGETDAFSLSARPRWPLDTTQPGMLGSGKKGAKA